MFKSCPHACAGCAGCSQEGRCAHAETDQTALKGGALVFKSMVAFLIPLFFALTGACLVPRFFNDELPKQIAGTAAAFALGLAACALCVWIPRIRAPKTAQSLK